MRVRHVGWIATGGITLGGGCALLAGLLELLLLGAMPTSGFSDPGSADYGRVSIAVGADNTDDASPASLVGELLEVEADDGSDVFVDGVRDVEGHERGSLVILVDGSGSVEDTDPRRGRVAATTELAKTLHEYGPEWRISLMEFSNGQPSEGFDDTHILADFTTDTAVVESAAPELGASGGTPLWDATHEVLAVLAADASSSFVGSDNAGMGLVVMSDGADTESRKSLSDVVALASQHGIAVHTIGFGPASDIDASRSSSDVEDVRRLASETGGFYGYVSEADKLPDLCSDIAKSLIGGYQELDVRFDKPPTQGQRVAGKVKVVGTDIGVPFEFQAP